MSLEEQFRQHELQDAERHGQILGKLGGIESTLKAINDRLDRTSDDVEEITGSHLVVAQDTGKFWRNLFLGVVGTIAAVALGAFSTWLTMKGH